MTTEQLEDYLDLYFKDAIEADAQMSGVSYAESLKRKALFLMPLFREPCPKLEKMEGIKLESPSIDNRKWYNKFARGVH